MKISIKRPCGQEWKRMQDLGKKRYCASCSKIVHDFTRYTDEQLISFFKEEREREVCGRIEYSRLNKDLSCAKVIRAPFNGFWAAFIAFLAFLKSSYCQLPALKNDCGIEMVPVAKAKNEFPAAKESRILSCLVLEKGQNSAVPFCEIKIEGIEKTFITDEHGIFEIGLPDS